MCIRDRVGRRSIRIADLYDEEKLKDKKPTIPSTIEDEIQTNIFLRCNEPSIKNALNLNNASEQEIFSKLRDLKDSF